MQQPQIVERFRGHVTSVHRLMNFDRDVLDFAIKNLRDLEQRLRAHHKLDNPHLTVGRTLEIVQGIREHNSLRPRYETIFNQALVLLVSYFASSVHDLFRFGIAAELDRGTDSAILKEQIRVTFRELVEADYNIKDLAPDLLVQAKDISFQDMQSIWRAFKENLGLTIERTPVVNEIIFAQACRHAIVHTGGIADDRIVRQVSGAKPRSLKPDLRSGERIQFSIEEVTQVSEYMTAYIEGVTALLVARYGLTEW